MPRSFVRSFRRGDDATLAWMSLRTPNPCRIVAKLEARLKRGGRDSAWLPILRSSSRAAANRAVERICEHHTGTDQLFATGKCWKNGAFALHIASDAVSKALTSRSCSLV
eukprot:scaffold2971_cov274-Pinguiococcus_pyrenoidosus.AAC.12